MVSRRERTPRSDGRFDQKWRCTCVSTIHRNLFLSLSLSVSVCLSLTYGHRTRPHSSARAQREEGILSCGNTGGRNSGPGHAYSSNGTMTHPTVNTARTRQRDNSPAYLSPGGGSAPHTRLLEGTCALIRPV